MKAKLLTTLISLVLFGALVAVSFYNGQQPARDEAPPQAFSKQNSARDNTIGQSSQSPSDSGQSWTVTETAAEGVITFEPPSQAGFVGTESCRECHPDLVESYQGHPMYFGSTRMVRDDIPPPQSSKEVIAGQKRLLHAEVVDGETTHHESMMDANGELIYDQPHPMQFVVGSGRRAKAYVHQHGSTLCLSPLNWFGKTQNWGLNPGYTADDPRRFERVALTNCLQCHTGRLNTTERGANEYSEPPFLEHHIGCERCHGPGEDHIAFHTSSTATGSNQAVGKNDPIVNPDKLESFERDSVCYQCHLQPSSNRILRAGRSHEDFRPGMRLDDVWLVIDSNDSSVGDGKTRSVRQVQQMRESKCFQASGVMSCTTCHDPHSVPNESERLEFYRQSCTQCHTPEQDDCAESMDVRSAVQDSCIECHMPQMDLALSSHASQTDHRVLRVPEQPDEDAASSESHSDEQPSNQRERTQESRGGLSFFDNHARNVPTQSKRRAIALFQVQNETITPELLNELESLCEVFPEDGTLWLAHGAAAIAQRDGKTAIHSLTRASKYPIARQRALAALTELSYSTGDWDRTITYSRSLLAINPYQTNIHVLRADALLQAGFPDLAIESAESAIQLDPGLEQVHLWLSSVRMQMGQTALAKENQRTANRIRKAMPPKNKQLPLSSNSDF